MNVEIILMMHEKKQKIEHPNNTNCKNKTKYSQNQFDEDVTNYIIHSMAPLNTLRIPITRFAIVIHYEVNTK